MYTFRPHQPTTYLYPTKTTYTKKNTTPSPTDHSTKPKNKQQGMFMQYAFHGWDLTSWLRDYPAGYTPTALDLQVCVCTCVDSCVCM